MDMYIDESMEIDIYNMRYTFVGHVKQFDWQNGRRVWLVSQGCTPWEQAYVKSTVEVFVETFFSRADKRALGKQGALVQVISYHFNEYDLREPPSVKEIIQKIEDLIQEAMFLESQE